MIYQALDSELKLLAKTPGVIACVLVSADTGMIFLSSAKSEQVEVMAEAARDYWVLHQKNGKVFEALGSVRNVFIQHERAHLSVQMFGHSSMLLVTIAKLRSVDWGSWPASTKKISELLCKLDVSGSK